MATITTTTPPANLTGWAVTVPSGWSASASEYLSSFYLTEPVFYVYSANDNISRDFYGLAVGYTSNLPNTPLPSDNSIVLGLSDGRYAVNASNSSPITFIFYDNPDADPLYTDSDLIQWFVDNGATFKQVPLNLTGYSVSVPDGWTAPSSYGRFNILCDILGDVGGDNDSYSGVMTVSLGYLIADWEETGSSNRIAVITEAGVYHNLVNTSDNLVFSITGGDDVSNGAFLNWFVLNEATFVNNNAPEEPDTPEEPTTTSHGEIYYDGNLVDTLIEGEFIVLHAKDFKFLGDIVIKNVGEVEEEEAPTLISFTIDGATYYSPEGWDWYQWVNDTTYNTNGAGCGSVDGFVYAPNGKFLFEGEGYTADDQNSDAIVTGSELIIANHDYYSMSGGF